MKASKILQTGVLLATTSLVLALGGCTYLGYRIGRGIDAKPAAADAAEPTRPAPLSRWAIGEIAKDTYLTVSTGDGSIREGAFTGFAAVPEPEYRVAYERARLTRSNDPGLPPLGEAITLTDRKGNRRTARFTGVSYNPRSSLVQPDAIPQDPHQRVFQGILLRLQPIPAGVRFFVSLGNIQDIAGADGSTLVDPATLGRLVYDGAVPLTTAVALLSYGKTTTVGLDRVERLTALGPREQVKGGVATLVFSGIGLVLDLAVVTVGMIAYGIAHAGM